MLEKPPLVSKYCILFNETAAYWNKEGDCHWSIIAKLFVVDPTPLTHWLRDKIAVIFQTTFSKVFSWMTMYEFRLTFHRICSQMSNYQYSSMGQIMAWRRPGDKPLSEPMMVSLLIHICVTRPQRVKRTMGFQCVWSHVIWVFIAQYTE